MKSNHVSAFWLFGLFFLLGGFAQLVAGHLDAGSDQTIGNYLVDFGYSPGNLTAGEKVVMAINLANASSEEVIPPTSVWIRISTGEDVVFAGTFHPEAKHVVFTYVFPKPGNYTVDAKVMLQNESIPALFNVTVQPKPSVSTAMEGLHPDFYAAAGIFFILAIAAGIIARRFNKPA